MEHDFSAKGKWGWKVLFGEKWGHIIVRKTISCLTWLHPRHVEEALNILECYYFLRKIGMPNNSTWPDVFLPKLELHIWHLYYC